MSEEQFESASITPEQYADTAASAAAKGDLQTARRNFVRAAIGTTEAEVRGRYRENAHAITTRLCLIGNLHPTLMSHGHEQLHDFIKQQFGKVLAGDHESAHRTIAELTLKESSREIAEGYAFAAAHEIATGDFEIALESLEGARQHLVDLDDYDRAALVVETQEILLEQFLGRPEEARAASVVRKMYAEAAKRFKPSDELDLAWVPK